MDTKVTKARAVKDADNFISEGPVVRESSRANDLFQARASAASLPEKIPSNQRNKIQRIGSRKTGPRDVPIYEIDAHFSGRHWIQGSRYNGAEQTGLLTLEAGEATGDKSSTHAESDQVLIVLQGELTAEIAGESEVMDIGDAVTVPAKTPHRFINTGRERAITFSVYALPAFPPDKQSD